MASVFTLDRCSSFDEWHPARPDNKDRATYAFVELTDAEVHANGLAESQYVYDRGGANTNWVLRVPLSEIDEAPYCERCGAFRLDLEIEWHLGDSREVCPTGCSLRSQREEARLADYLRSLR